VLTDALASPAYTAVTAEVGTSTDVLWQFAAGHLAEDSTAVVTRDTIFDLASLTKVLSTTALLLPWFERGAIGPETPVASRLTSWLGADRADVTIRDLLEHASGLPAYRPYYETLSGRFAYERAIGVEPLAYQPRQQSMYSDLGFILLGFVLEDLAALTLDAQFDAWRRTARIVEPLLFHPGTELRARIAATERDPWRGRVIIGDVHDENAAALGGAAGHAGLFGTAAAVGETARWWLRLLTGHDDDASGISARTAALCVQRSAVPGSSRALGWDTMLTTSSCGTRWSAHAIGHTGFTGTSLWLDPSRDRYAVLLTNRVHPTRANDRIQGVRRAFHDAVALDLD
jgi:CubicO group peptidase (beta-lactamase class C family)